MPILQPISKQSITPSLGRSLSGFDTPTVHLPVIAPGSGLNKKCYIAVMQNVTVDWLKSIENLRDVPANQLQWRIDNSRHYTMAAGEHLFNVGETAIGTHIVVEG